jgi:hypothetical protein
MDDDKETKIFSKSIHACANNNNKTVNHILYVDSLYPMKILFFAPANYTFLLTGRRRILCYFKAIVKAE